MRLFRSIIALSLALYLLVGVALSPAVSAHVVESHDSPLAHHVDHARESETLSRPGPSHDDHHHSTIEVVGDGIRHRVEHCVDVPAWSAVPAIVRCLEYAVISTPILNHLPPSRTTVLRI